MFYDPSTSRVILFGGRNDNGRFNDTWAFDAAANIWTRLRPSGGPPPARASVSLARDTDSGKAVLFGGEGDGAKALRDTWAYDPRGDNWVKLEPAGSIPAARVGHSMVFDPRSGKVIMFGGSEGASIFGDTWTYDLVAGAWTNLDPVGHPLDPSARTGQAMIHDPRVDQVLRFGGLDEHGVYHNDIWAYDSEANTWTNISLLGELPETRGGFALAFDPGLGKVIFFGGSVLNECLGDMWSYDAQR
jgi:hypothetical protein